MTTTDTPRTDEAAGHAIGIINERVLFCSRQLERELATLEAEFQHYRENQNTFTIALCEESEQRAEKAEAEVERLRDAIVTAYTHNQNMHCYQTKGRLNDELNNQTMVLRKALNPTDTPRTDAYQYADYILNHYDRNSHMDKLCLARSLVERGYGRAEKAEAEVERLRSTMRSFIDFMDENLGTTADWPMEAVFDDEETCLKHCDHLNAMKRIVKPEGIN